MPATSQLDWHARGAKGVGHQRWIGSTGNGRNPIINGRRQPSLGGTSRMMLSGPPSHWLAQRTQTSYGHFGHRVTPGTTLRAGVPNGADEPIADPPPANGATTMSVRARWGRSLNAGGLPDGVGV